MILSMTKLLWSEGYCYLLDYAQIAYYPAINRITRIELGRRFRPKQNETIADLGNSVSFSMTGLSVAQLRQLFLHLRIPDQLIYRGYYNFKGEEAFLHYIYWN